MPTSTGASQASHGRVTRVRGSVVDVGFEGPPAPLQRLLHAGSGRVALEVASHPDTRTARCVALEPARGLARGDPVTDSGGPIEVPVGRATLGRVFDVFGRTVDPGGTVEAHSTPPLPRARPPAPSRPPPPASPAARPPEPPAATPPHEPQRPIVRADVHADS